MGAGTDTTATTVEWAMAELLKHPQTMKRAKEEIGAAVEEGVEFEETYISNLAFLDAVVKETLRLHPALPLLVPRSPSSTCTIAGYTVPEGTKVFINAWAIQRDPRVWENAYEFKPERFLSEDGAMDYSGNAFKYLPFGAGRRICPGIQLGERMVMFILASLLHSADWALLDGEEANFKEKFGLVMKTDKPLVAIPTTR